MATKTKNPVAAGDGAGLGNVYLSPADDIPRNSTSPRNLQILCLRRFGLTQDRAAILAPHAFGEVAR